MAEQLARLNGPDDYGIDRAGGRMYQAPQLFPAAFTVLDDHAISGELRTVRFGSERPADAGAAYTGRVRIAFVRPIRLIRAQCYVRSELFALRVLTSSTLRHHCIVSNVVANSPDELRVARTIATIPRPADPANDWDELASGTGRITYENAADGLCIEPSDNPDDPTAIGFSQLDYVFTRTAGAAELDIAIVHLTYRVGRVGAVPR